MLNKKVAIVTGSAKGIGFEIVKKLCREFDGDVFLTARNSENGKKAVEKLNRLGLSPKFYQLNVVDHYQVEEFAQFIGKTYGGVDILVNNAAVLYKKSERYPLSQLINEQIETNFTSVLSLINAFFPWFRSNARIVNVSSRMGTLWYVKNKQLKARLRDPKLSLDELIDIMEDFINAANQGAAGKLGYPNSNMGSYSMSKLGVNALTRVVQNIFDQDKTRKGIVVSAVCPGYCRTDMSKNRGILSPARGAETPVHFCLLPPDWEGPKGAFWGENKQLDWEKGGLIESFFPFVKKLFISCLMCPFNFFKKAKHQQENYISFV